MQFLLDDQELGEGWPPVISGSDDDYSVSMMLVGSFIGDSYSDPALGAEDTALVTALPALLDVFRQRIADTETSLPAAPPTPGAKGYYRIRAEYNRDTDGDGISDRDELEYYSTDPFNPDSDGDGFTDWFELQEGFDPNNAEIVPEEFTMMAIQRRDMDYDFLYDLDSPESVEDPVNGSILTYSMWDGGFSNRIEESLTAPLNGSALNAPLTTNHSWPEAPELDFYSLSSGERLAGSEYTRTYDGFTSRDEASRDQGRAWLQSQPVSATPTTRTFLKKTLHYDGPSDGTGTPTPSLELIDFTMAPWVSQSSYVEFSPPSLIRPAQLFQKESYLITAEDEIVVKVNGTVSDKDDFIAVSGGIDNDLATEISIHNAGLAGGKAEFSVANSSGDNGEITFEDTTVTFSAAGVASTKMWGEATSKGKGTTFVVIKVRNSIGALVPPALGIKKNVTVFEGVEIKFGGTFYSPVDTRSVGRRASDGVAKNPSWGHPFPIIPPEFKNKDFFADAMNEDTRDVSGKLVFSKGDQGVTMRTWSSDPVVSVSSIKTLTPAVSILSLTGDPKQRKGGILSATGGSFRDTVAGDGPPRVTGGAYDLVLDPRFRFYYHGLSPVENVDDYLFEIKILDRDDDTRLNLLDLKELALEDTLAYNLAYRDKVRVHADPGGEGENLAKWGKLRFPTYLAFLDNQGSVRRWRAEWKNESFDVEKGASLTLSGAAHELEIYNSRLRIAALGIAARAETLGSKALKCEFTEITEFDEWTLSGELKGYVETN